MKYVEQSFNGLVTMGIRNCSKVLFQVISSSEERSKREKVNELGQIYRFIGKLQI